jgi:hypothetical protein
MSSPLFHCIYASAATRRFTTPELTSLLQQSRENNQRIGATGMLLHSESSFFQVLEGSEDVLQALYAKIALDPRHAQVTRIIWEPIAERTFDAWSMGFHQVSRGDLAGIAGVNDFFGAGQCTADIDEGRAKKVLAAFAEGRWRKKLAGARPMAEA